MGNVIFTQHALQKLQERRISKQMVLNTVRFPEKLVTAGEKIYVFRKFDKKYLKVIFVRERENIIIITQHFVNAFL